MTIMLSPKSFKPSERELAEETAQFNADVHFQAFTLLEVQDLMGICAGYFVMQFEHKEQIIENVNQQSTIGRIFSVGKWIPKSWN